VSEIAYERSKVDVIKIFQVDAFTHELFGGNPAAVCPLNHWLDAQLMQKIAMENAVAETAFIVPNGEGFDIRWFTPEVEMDLCGHATLAAAHVLKKHLDYEKPSVKFDSNSGPLSVVYKGDLIYLDFPSRKPVISTAPKQLLEAVSHAPIEVHQSRDYVLVYDDEKTILDITFDKNTLDKINIDPGGVIVTAKGDEADFVSRFFTPQASIMEDPVTGSAHCSLIPFWSERLKKEALLAHQLSSRKGVLYCENRGERVTIAGRAVTYSSGEIYL